MEIWLMEDNSPLMYDEIVGSAQFDLGTLTRDKWHKKTFVFNEVSEVDIEMKISLDQKPTLRYSLCLCEQEKSFLTLRKVKVMEAMKQLLGKKGPNNVDEVPTIAIIGSGGGFRAMVGLSGAVKGLYDAGIFQCATYLCGLSGSSWYISTLYSHPNWPKMAPGDMQDELKNNIDSSILWLLKPQTVYRYMDNIMRKRQNGQPVSFTDFFGHMVGETLLGNRFHCRLSEQHAKLTDGAIPMPLLTCVHVKKDRSERSFQEWVEFSPYEIGMAKYGTFMPTRLFGCKFFMGHLAKEYEEPPLHYLQGIWGSAFCILFKRLFEDNKRLDPAEINRQDMAKALEENEQDESSDSSDEGDFNDEDSTIQSAGNMKKASTLPANLNRLHGSPQRRSPHLTGCGGSMDSAPKRKVSTRRTKRKGYWTEFLKGVFENKRFELLSTRAGRAGVIHNFMRGLSLQHTYPLCPFTPVTMEPPEVPNKVHGSAPRPQSDDFDGIFEMHPTTEKHLYVVDAGLTFNSPYPVVLRPQREVDIILSFDFSARPGDSSPPFKELLLAAMWAKKHNLMFPPIDTTVFDREGMKELYIFRHPTEANCPIVLHFCLVNVEFRNFVKPGLTRKTKEEKQFADFDIFDDPATPYSTFNFKYPHLAFERLSKLTEFNTLLNVEAVKKVIVEIIEKKRADPNKFLFKLEDVPLLRRVSQKNKNRLSKFLTRIHSGRFSIKDAGKDLSQSIEDIPEEPLRGEDGPDNAPDQHQPLPLTSEDVPKLKRTRAITKKHPISNGAFKSFNAGSSQKTLTLPISSMSLDVSEASREEQDSTLRDIPGRRKPMQPEKSKQWQDSKCNSIDEDDGDPRFYTAIESPI
ncbi:cytosolic phospholipase A2-like isoform X2 [Dreissena polymorpha]|nr:cytosolic phospholipase A2-like isoform X2 [Dreissena polymorpha]